MAHNDSIWSKMETPKAIKKEDSDLLSFIRVNQHWRMEIIKQNRFL